MAEVAGITASIIAILRAIKATGDYLNGIKSASHEAQEVANQVETTKAILESIGASLRTFHHSQEFISIWQGTTKLVLDNIGITIGQLNKRLGVGGKAPFTRLSLWGKAKWPLQRAEGLRLQQHLQGYMTMLVMVQNAFFRGTLQIAQDAARDIDDILSQDGTYPSSSADGSGSFRSRRSEATLGPDDSISIIHSYQMSSNSRQTPYLGTGPTIAINSPSPIPQLDPSEPDHRSKTSSFRLVNKLIVFGFDARTTKYGNDESLGGGDVTVAASYDRSQLWLTFVPEGLEMHKTHWILATQNIELPRKFSLRNCTLSSEWNQGGVINIYCAIGVIGSKRGCKEGLTLLVGSTRKQKNFADSFNRIVHIVKMEDERQRREEAIMRRTYSPESSSTFSR